jgi:DNA-binding MarR family transcriptional regulator
MSSPKNVLVDIWMITHLADSLVAEMLHASPLSVDEFAVYGLIVDLAPITAADLARGTGMSPTTLSGIISRCERRGELERVENDEDRRSNLLRLTERGMQVYLAAVPALLEAIGRIDQHLGTAVEGVRPALELLDDALRTLRGVAPRPYRLEGAESTRELTPAQRAEVERYIDWMIHRDGGIHSTLNE